MTLRRGRGPQFARVRSVFLVALALVTASMLFPLTSAQGDNISGYSSNVDPLPCNNPGSGINRADGGTTKYWLDGLTQAVHYVLNTSIITTYDPTNLGMELVTGTPYDLKFKDKDYDLFCGFTWDSNGTGNGTWGLYSCHALKETGPHWNSCDKAIIRFDTSYLNYGLSYYDRESIACHEAGHGVGLKHKDGDCMEQGKNKDRDDLDSHSVGEINDTYLEP